MSTIAYLGRYAVLAFDIRRGEHICAVYERCAVSMLVCRNVKDHPGSMWHKSICEIVEIPGT